MTINKALQDFSIYLCNEFPAEVDDDDILTICKDILSNENIIEKLVVTYGNLPIWLIFYLKEVLNTDVNNFIDDELWSLLKKFNVYRYSSSIKLEELAKCIDYDNLIFEDKFIGLFKGIEVKNCTLKSDLDDYNLGLFAVNCENLIIDIPKLKKLDINIYSKIKNIVLNSDIDIKVFKPSLFEHSKTETIEYKGKKYKVNEFLKLAEQKRKEFKNNYKYKDLYIVRTIKDDSWSKRFYYYLFARKSLTSGKFRFAMLCDEGGPKYSTVYFKSKEDAIDILNKAGLSYLTKSIKKAIIRIEDVSNGFKEVKTEYGGNILIKNGSRGDV